MNVDLRLIVRLLLAILLTSLVTTILMGKQIHRRLVESMVKTTGEKDSLPARQLPKREISPKVADFPPPLTLNQTELDILKIQRNNSFRLPQQEAIKEWQDAIFFKEDSNRRGLGEQGRAVQLPNAKLNPDDFQDFYAELSDRIPLNRSLPDTRPIRLVPMKFKILYNLKTKNLVAGNGSIWRTYPM